MSAMYKIHARNTLLTLVLALCSSSALTTVDAHERSDTLQSAETSQTMPDGTPKAKLLYKIDQQGNRLADDSQTWECVEDPAAELFWQKRSPSSALHGHDSYNWYQPEQIPSGQPRSNPELPGLDESCFGYNADDPGSYCNTNAFTDRVNQSNYCGFSDWRLPTAEELLSLVDPTLSGRPDQSAIDVHYFPHKERFAYWTNTVDSEGVVVTVINDETLLHNSERNDHLLIRLVRGVFQAE